MRTNFFVPNSSNISARYTNYISLHNIHYYIGTNNRTKLSDNTFEQYFRTILSNKILLCVIKNCLFQYNYRRLFRMLIVFLCLKFPLFSPFPPPHRLRFLFYSILTLSLSLRFFTCDFSPSSPAISFTYCRLKQSPCPKFHQHSSVFTLSTPRFNLSNRFISHPFERSFA